MSDLTKYRLLQEHIEAIRDHIAGARACIYGMSVRGTLPEGNFERLAGEIDKLAAGIRSHAEAARNRTINHAEAEARVDALIASVHEVA